MYKRQDIGGSHIAIAKVEENKIIDKKEYNYDEKFKEEIRKNIVEYIKKEVSEIIEKEKIEKVGISIAGRLRENVLYISPNLKQLEGINFVEILEPYFKIPVTVNKDSFCAGKAEKVYGCLKNYNTAVFLIIGTGIGAISYRNNKLQRDGYGHMIIEKDGRQCKCGKKGCFETYGSITALKRSLQEYLKKENMTGKEVHDYLETHQNEEPIKKIIDNYIQNFCTGLSSIIDIVLPEAVGFGGSFSYYQDLFLEKIEEKFKTQKLLADDKSVPVFTFGTLKNDAGIIGATLF